MSRFPTTALLLLALTLAAPALAQDVKYERYTLDNGLTVILHEDHRLPVVSINTWFYVGAKDEPAGRSGFAHLFEHLMFMGTERVPVGQYDLIMEGGGGANNASTGFDRTNYYSWGPVELLPTLLWLDADRMEDLGRMMNQEKLDLQRSVVLNERRQTTENTPYGRSEVRVVDLLYPDWHPYHDGVIGSHADLEAATVDDVKEFFANFYVPNNASLVVAGDFDPAVVKPLIEEQFGSLQRGADPVRCDVPRPQPEGDIRCTMLDKVQLPMVRFAGISPDKFQPGDAEMEILAEILGMEKSGRLYRRLVMEEGLAVDVSVSQDSLMLGSAFSIDVLAKPAADLDRIEQVVDEDLARFYEDGATAEELTQVVIGIEREVLSRLENLRWKADKLNEYQFHLGEPNSFRADLDRYRAVTVESLREWRVLEPGRRVIVRVLPEEPARAATARDQRPPNLPERTFEPEAPVSFMLDNGIPVSLWQRHDLPMVELTLLFKAPAGRVLDRADAVGSASLLAKMLKESAGDRDAVAFAAALELLGADLDTQADRQSLEVSLSTLRRTLEPALGLFADAVLRPRFAGEDWQRVHALHLEGLKRQADNPNAVATRAASRVLFGADHPYGRPTSGTIGSVSALDPDLVLRLYRELVVPANARFVVAGDLTVESARELLEGAFGSWTAVGPGGGYAADWSFAPADGLNVALVDRPGAVQTVIRFIAPGVTRGDARRVPYEMIGTVLGGTFTSRLNSNLREDKGFTYGASARFDMNEKCGTFSAGSSVRSDVTGAALVEFFREFDGLRGGDVTAADLEKARGAIRTDGIESFASLSGTVSRFVELLKASLPFETVAEDLAALNDVSVEQANGMAREAIPLESAVLVLVGDAGVIREQLQGLGLPDPVLVTADGEPVQ